MAAPTTGPAAIPRKVSAPTTPNARGRIAPPNRCDAAAVPTGTSTPPPTAWTSRAAMSWSSDWAAPASADPIDEDHQRAHEQPPDAPQVGQPAGHRHGQDVDQQVAVDDPAGLAQLDPGGAAVRVGQVGQDRRQRDRGDHELEAGQEDADPDDGEEHVRRAAVHAGSVVWRASGSRQACTNRYRRARWPRADADGGGATTSEIVEGTAAATPIAAAAGIARF